MILKILLPLICAIQLLSCQEAITIKPMKYNRHGQDLSCSATYKDETLVKVVCFSAIRDTVLIEDYVDGIRDGNSILMYDNGSIQEYGQFKNGHQEGIWNTFYPTGIRKSYKYYEIERDTSFLIYEKKYDSAGNLFSYRYPLSFKTNNENEQFKVGESYQLIIELRYSEYDSINSLGIFEESEESSVKADTVLFEGNSLYLEFTPKIPGTHKIKGRYVEIDGSKRNREDGYGGEKEFEFNYIAIR